MLGLEPYLHHERRKAGSGPVRRFEFDSAAGQGSQRQCAIELHPGFLVTRWCRQVGTASDGLRSGFEVDRSAQPCVGSGSYIVFHHDRHHIR